MAAEVDDASKLDGGEREELAAALRMSLCADLELNPQMKTVAHYVAMFPMLERCIIADIVGMGGEGIEASLEEMAFQCIDQTETDNDDFGQAACGRDVGLDEQVERAKQRLQSEFSQVDEDVICFVLSQCSNSEGAARNALKTQEERALGLKGDRPDQAFGDELAASEAKVLAGEFLGVHEDVIVFVLAQSGNNLEGARQALRQMLPDQEPDEEPSPAAGHAVVKTTSSNADLGAQQREKCFLKDKERPAREEGERERQEQERTHGQEKVLKAAAQADQLERERREEEEQQEIIEQQKQQQQMQEEAEQLERARERREEEERQEIIEQQKQQQQMQEEAERLERARERREEEDRQEIIEQQRQQQQMQEEAERLERARERREDEERQEIIEQQRQQQQMQEEAERLERARERREEEERQEIIEQQKLQQQMQEESERLERARERREDEERQEIIEQQKLQQQMQEEAERLERARERREDEERCQDIARRNIEKVAGRVSRASAVSGLAGKVEKWRATKLLLQREFDQFDEDVLAFVLAESGNDVERARQALRQMLPDEEQEMNAAAGHAVEDDSFSSIDLGAQQREECFLRDKDRVEREGHERERQEQEHSHRQEQARKAAAQAEQVGRERREDEERQEIVEIQQQTQQQQMQEDAGDNFEGEQYRRSIYVQLEETRTRSHSHV